MNNFLLSEEITSAFPNLLGNCSWVLGQCTSVALNLCELIATWQNFHRDRSMKSSLRIWICLSESTSDFSNSPELTPSPAKYIILLLMFTVLQP
jgi:hypothetical protein